MRPWAEGGDKGGPSETDVPAANSFPESEEGQQANFPMAFCSAALGLPWQHHPAGASQSSPYPALTFGHLIENHVDQDVGATPAGAIT